MLKKITFTLLLIYSFNTFSQTKTIHTYVALCDNQFQGIVPVPKNLGNGKDTRQNLYWGAMYGVKSFFKTCTEDFLKASNHQNSEKITFNHKELSFGGGANLISYVGHDGLMDFKVDVSYKPTTLKKKEVIILACYSRNYFTPELKKANAKPLLWTTHLMAPEAYTLQAAFTGWINNETDQQIDERAAQAYHKYQKCGIKGARNLLTTGFKK